MEIHHSEEYRISDDREHIDFEQVAGLLKNAFWSPGIGTEEVIRGARNSALVVAACYNREAIIGYLRVISDRTRFAYLLDVYVDERHRKKGIARSMVRFAQSHPDLSDVYQWLLITRDAHELYRGAGFGPLPEPAKWMCILKPRPER